MDREGMLDYVRRCDEVVEKVAGSDAIVRTNLDAVKGMVEAIARDDYEGFARFLADDVRLRILAPPDVPFIRSADGVTAFVDAARRNFAMLEGRQPVPLSVVARGERVIRILREQGHYSEDGRRYDLHGAQEFVFREGKLASLLEILARS
jgi:ketosteroid isomerase-like protein